jgi:hypothetical protein
MTGNPSTPLRVLLVRSLGLTVFIFALLEFWRPCYFLTDDNFGGGFPLLTGMGQRMIHGQSPFIADDIFGGYYGLLRDPSSFIWHPFYLLAALLANTPAHFAIMDVAALGFLLVAAAGFTCLAHFLRADLKLPLSDARLVFFTLSYTFSMIVLCTSSSWLNFLGNHSALPWLALGILQPQWRRGLGLVALFSVHGLLGGHLAATVSNSIFLTLFAIGVSACRRSWQPLGQWCAGYALAVLILLPLLIPVSEGFLTADRSAGLAGDVMSRFSFPAVLVPFSYLLGVMGVFGFFGQLQPGHFVFGTTQLFYASAFFSCAGAWALFPALLKRGRWQGIERVCLSLVLLLVLFVVRPAWLNNILLHLPLLKSMRWPFREILQFQFFLHLFFILRPPGGTLLFQRIMLAGGLLIFAGPLFLLPAPTFLPLTLDRELLFSGRSAVYWQRIGQRLAPGTIVVPVADPELVRHHPFEVPFSLFGAYNFPILFHVPSATGYSVTVPRGQLYLQTPPAMNIGLFSPDQKAAILAEQPNVAFLTLESVAPLKLTLSLGNGPAVDVTGDLPQ